MSITTLLRFFGVSMAHGDRRDFVYREDMNAIYRDVRQNYREQMKKCHPDKGGSEESAMEINKNWSRLEQWYRNNCPSAFYGLLLSMALVALCGCRSIELTLPGGSTLKSTSFACKLSVGTAGVSTNGTAYMTNYNLDQVAGMQAIAAGVVEGMVAGAKK